jgi:cold shock CspA family protein
MASSTPRTHIWESLQAGQWEEIGDANVQDAVDAAFLAASDGYRFSSGGCSYEIDFQRMVELNRATQSESSLRRRIPDPPTARTAAAAAPRKPRWGCGYMGCCICYGPGARASAYSAYSPSVAPYSTTSRPYSSYSTSNSYSTSKPYSSTKPSSTNKLSSTNKASPMSPPVQSGWRRSRPAPVAPKATVASKTPGRGVVSFFKNRAYGLAGGAWGFISMNDGTEVYFHISALNGGSVQLNDTVEVPKLRPPIGGSARRRAREVRVLKNGSTSDGVQKQGRSSQG